VPIKTIQGQNNTYSLSINHTSEVF
jgi:hypothetical protein